MLWCFQIKFFCGFFHTYTNEVYYILQKKNYQGENLFYFVMYIKNKYQFNIQATVRGN